MYYLCNENENKTNEVKIIMSEFGSVCFYCVIVDVIHYYEDSFYASKNVNLHEGKYSIHFNENDVKS